MQSTGHSSTQDMSVSPMHAEVMKYGNGALLGGDVGGVSGEKLEVGVEGGGRVVDRRGHLTEPDGDEADLPLVVGDVARRVDEMDPGRHPRVDEDPAISHRQPPGLQRTE